MSCFWRPIQQTSKAIFVDCLTFAKTKSLLCICVYHLAAAAGCSTSFIYISCVSLSLSLSMCVVRVCWIIRWNIKLEIALVVDLNRELAKIATAAAKHYFICLLACLLYNCNHHVFDFDFSFYLMANMKYFLTFAYWFLSALFALLLFASLL